MTRHAKENKADAGRALLQAAYDSLASYDLQVATEQPEKSGGAATEAAPAPRPAPFTAPPTAPPLAPASSAAASSVAAVNLSSSSTAQNNLAVVPGTSVSGTIVQASVSEEDRRAAQEDTTGICDSREAALERESRRKGEERNESRQPTKELSISSLDVDVVSPAHPENTLAAENRNNTSSSSRENSKISAGTTTGVEKMLRSPGENYTSSIKPQAVNNNDIVIVTSGTSKRSACSSPCSLVYEADEGSLSPLHASFWDEDDSRVLEEATRREEAEEAANNTNNTIVSTVVLHGEKEEASSEVATGRSATGKFSADGPEKNIKNIREEDQDVVPSSCKEEEQSILNNFGAEQHNVSDSCRFPENTSTNKISNMKKNSSSQEEMPSSNTSSNSLSNKSSSSIINGRNPSSCSSSSSSSSSGNDASSCRPRLLKKKYPRHSRTAEGWDFRAGRVPPFEPVFREVLLFSLVILFAMNG